MEYKELLENGNKLGTELEGTVIFYLYQGLEYAVLADNTVITKAEWETE